MGKTVTLNLRVSPDAKQGAEAVLKQLGIPMSTAIDLYLRQISLTNSIPFSISLPTKGKRLMQKKFFQNLGRNIHERISSENYPKSKR